MLILFIEIKVVCQMLYHTYFMYICYKLHGIPTPGKLTVISKRASASVSFQKQQRTNLRKWPQCCWMVLPSYLGFQCPVLLTTSLLTLHCTAETMKVSASSSSRPRVNHHMVVSPHPALFAIGMNPQYSLWKRWSAERNASSRFIVQSSRYIPENPIYCQGQSRI